MSVDVETLLVDGDEALRDTSRLRRVYRQTVLTNRLVSAAGAAVCSACMWATGYFAWAALTGSSPIVAALWVAALASAVMTGFGAVFCFAFWKEASLSPLCGYFENPGAYDFVAARVVSATWRRGNSGPGDFLVKTLYNGGECFTIVKARSWSRRFTTKTARRSLKKADDRRADDAARRTLPVQAWVLRGRDRKDAELVAIVSEFGKPE
jgi:hypothetical protein